MQIADCNEHLHFQLQIQVAAAGCSFAFQTADCTHHCATPSCPRAVVQGQETSYGIG